MNEREVVKLTFKNLEGTDKEQQIARLKGANKCKRFWRYFALRKLLNKK